MNEKVLVVDNQPVVLKLMSNFLEKRGCEVRTAPGSLAALDVLENFTPDVIFVDLIMPNISGDKLCRIIRSMPRFHDVCIIVLSAIAAEEELDFASFGADACIAKGPFKVVEGHIARILEHRKEKKGCRAKGIIGLEDIYKREITGELLTSKKHSEIILSNIAEGIIECTADGTVVYVNSSASSIIGIPEEKILAAKILDFFTGESRVAVENAFLGLGSHMITIGETVELTMHDRRVALTLLPIHDAGALSKVVIIHDITARKHVEEKLAGYREHLEKMVVDRTAELSLKNEELKREIAERRCAEEGMSRAQREWERTFDAVDDIVTLQDTSMRITRVNKATCRILEKDEKELIGKYCYELFRGTSEPCRDCPEFLANRIGKSFSSEIIHPLLGKTFLVTATPLVDDNGQSIGMAHFAKDITEQKKLEIQLLQAQKMEAIGTLAGGIAHDFNNILAAVLGYTELAMLDVPEGNPVYAKLAEVTKAGQRARDLVAQILAFSRHSEVKTEPLELRLIVKEALKLLRASLPTTIEIRQNISNDPCWILGDPVQAHQVLMNLCTNASHAMKEKGGVLEVTVAEEYVHNDNGGARPGLVPGAYVRMSVRDTGMGMDQSVLARIYEPFFTTKKTGEGTGMGLAVVHGIVKSHNGAIFVDSTPGQGSAFHLYFPRITDADEIVTISSEDQLPRGSERILFVDDEPPLAELGRQLLTFLGYEVTALTDSSEALTLFKEQPHGVDLLITDLTMPGVTGADLAREALALRPELPVIICTGHSDLLTEEQAHALGVREYVLKPLVTQKIAEIIRKTLDG